MLKDIVDCYAIESDKTRKLFYLSFARLGNTNDHKFFIRDNS